MIILSPTIKPSEAAASSPCCSLIWSTVKLSSTSRPYKELCFFAKSKLLLNTLSATPSLTASADFFLALISLVLASPNLPPPGLYWSVISFICPLISDAWLLADCVSPLLTPRSSCSNATILSMSCRSLTLGSTSAFIEALFTRSKYNFCRASSLEISISALATSSSDIFSSVRKLSTSFLEVWALLTLYDGGFLIAL